MCSSLEKCYLEHLSHLSFYLLFLPSSLVQLFFFTKYLSYIYSEHSFHERIQMHSSIFHSHSRSFHSCGMFGWNKRIRERKGFEKGKESRKERNRERKGIEVLNKSWHVVAKQYENRHHQEWARLCDQRRNLFYRFISSVASFFCFLLSLQKHCQKLRLFVYPSETVTKKDYRRNGTHRRKRLKRITLFCQNQKK